jgi:molybdate transport system ATP-binding protein
MSIYARLGKRFPATAGSDAFELDIQLSAPPGIIVILGPSGSGKSLTLNCVAGFARPDEGRILVNDKLFFDAAAKVNTPPQQRHCGYIFQDHALFPHMTVRENLGFAASAARTAGRGLVRRRRINELLEAFELTGLANRKPIQISGGERQRAALARILVSEPQILLLDEPTRGLDARLRQTFYDILRQTQERLGVPMLLVTHDVEECFALADFICLMQRGRFLQAAARDEVLCRPASASAARFLGLYSIVPAEIKALDPGNKTSLLLLLGQTIGGQYLPGHLIGDRGLLCIREAEIKVLPPECHVSQRTLLLEVVAVSLRPYGVHIELAGDVAATVSQADFEVLRSRPQLALEIPPSALSFVSE